MGQDASSLRAKEINDLSHNDETANGSTKEKTVIQKNNTKSNETLTSFQSVVAEPSLKTISSISDEDHDVVDDDDSTTISDYLTEDEYDDDDEQEDDDEQLEYDEEVEEFLRERKMILQEARTLKTYAEFYYYPDQDVVVDGTAFARSYFSRPSAPEVIPVEQEDERDMVLQDALALKKLAVDYLHPERPVQVTDPFACGRNYFERPSAVAAPSASETLEEEEYKNIMQDLKQLKVTAGWYLHPERKVDCDGFSMGRNYYSRPSAEPYETDVEVEETELIRKDLVQLKTTAEWYLQPEQKVVVDPICLGRNYFARKSASNSEEEDHRQQILADTNELKKIAHWYMHTEDPVLCDDPCSTARNYYSRPSAVEFEDEDEMYEHERVLSEALEMKKYADWYLHPEKSVQTDAYAYGRNYYSRPSAPEQEDEDFAEERARVLAEAKKLKEVAEWFYFPEKPVVTDGFASGRNYFNRPSAPMDDVDEEQQQRELVLADAKNLKRIAEWYHCPEKPVEMDATACARNYFSRPSATEYEDVEEAKAKVAVLEDATKLKEVAGWYHHPEIPVTSNIAVTRNYFTRPSADEQIETMEQEEERDAILADSMQLKKLAIDYLHPEKPVESSINCIRNYFDRASAPGHADHIHTEGHSINEHGYMADHHIDHREIHHDDYYHYNDYADHHHDDDYSHGNQSDHFEMDEDVFQNFRQSLVAHQEHQVHTVPIIKEIDEKEGKLSRSPSDVMLFDEAVI